MPLREPSGVDVLVTLPAGVRPSEVQDQLDDQVSVTTRARPHIALEEIDGDDVTVRVSATVSAPDDGPALADEVLATLTAAAATGDGRPG